MQFKVKSQIGYLDAKSIGFSKNPDTHTPLSIVTYDSGRLYDGHPECEMDYDTCTETVSFVWHPYDHKSCHIMTENEIGKYLIKINNEKTTRVEKFAAYRHFLCNFVAVLEEKSFWDEDTPIIGSETL